MMHFILPNVYRAPLVSWKRKVHKRKGARCELHRNDKPIIRDMQSLGSPRRCNFHFDFIANRAAGGCCGIAGRDGLIEGWISVPDRISVVNTEASVHDFVNEGIATDETDIGNVLAIRIRAEQNQLRKQGDIRPHSTIRLAPPGMKLIDLSAGRALEVGRQHRTNEHLHSPLSRRRIAMRM